MKSNVPESSQTCSREQSRPLFFIKSRHSLSKNLRLRLQILQRLLVMTRNDLSSRRPLQLLEPLCALEPRWVITSEPSLGNSITPVLDDVAVIADEEVSAHVRHVDLHANKAVGVSWEMMQRDALTEIKSSLVEGLPVPVHKLTLMFYLEREGSKHTVRV